MLTDDEHVFSFVKATTHGLRSVGSPVAGDRTPRVNKQNSSQQIQRHSQQNQREICKCASTTSALRFMLHCINIIIHRYILGFQFVKDAYHFGKM